MARLFIFAVGGTGARVLRSLTMLLAAGLRLPDCEQVVPVLVDPDTQNGDVTRTVDLLKRYARIHQALHQDGQHPRGPGFFGQSLSTLAQLNEGGGVQLADSFVYDFGGINQSFRDYIRYGDASVETRGLLDLLFTPDSLDANLDLGFRGSPNVGSVVLNSLVQAPEMTYLAQTLNANDRVFFISSIFGGTGAAGFPLLVKNLRNPDGPLPQHNVRGQVKAGALVMLPYFKLQQPTPQERAEGRDFIDSNTFITKTKTALSYYANHLDGLEALYYLGDQAGQPLPNNPGRSEQRNQAHLLELLGALAIPHFLEQPAAQLDRRNPAYHEFGLGSAAASSTLFDFSQLPPELRQSVARPMIRFHYFARYFQQHLLAKKDTPLFRVGQLGRHLPANAGPLADLTSFFGEYDQWLRELGVNERKFGALLADETDFNHMVKDKPIKTGFLNSGLTDQVLRTELDKAVSGTKSLENPDAARALRWLVEAFDVATEKVVADKLQYS
ncbi:hypothetical protein EJV47_02605 [Hymenobacter gummosus]|uniref:Uncharacterized protein n=1 Tax=Hymenobacter gummosus TaxID=1776032 RepID=A0A3S0K939_9BACT|nr:hypothetical protein [Hymenobacter gummosus]RTQ53645.1 hypothetical protein EJV47_02605 [Hymenobacter gummosus]